jgi:hypothetical protein
MGILHVVNGDSTRITLEQADLPGEISVYADVLHEGPVLHEWLHTSMHSWLEMRARFLAGDDLDSYGDALVTLSRWQSAFDRHASYDEVVLWFEHDLFDQLLLIRHLSWFQNAGRTRGLRLICGEQYLGHLDANQLAALYPTREEVTEAQMELAARAWRAFTSNDPMTVQALLDHATGALPYLHGALVRFLEEYPWTVHGLGRTDAQLLALLEERPRSATELFVENAKREERVFMGDSVFWTHVRQLQRAPTPLLEVHEDMLRITDAGRDVVAGKSDAIALNGIDRWLGGVHLDRAAVWRWDPQQRRLTPV